MAKHKESEKKQRYNQRCIVPESDMESMERRNRRGCFQPHWIMLFALSLLLIYNDANRITACITINDRQMSVDLPKYLTSVKDALPFMTTNETPTLLRGSSTNIDATTIRTMSLEETHGHNPQKNEPTELEVVSKSSQTTDSSNDVKHADKPKTQNEILGTNQTIFANVQDRDNVRNAESDSNMESTPKSELNRLPPKVLCISGEPYGRTMNQYLQLATALHQLGINGTTVVGFKNNPFFTSFYTTWFESRNDIIIEYDNNAPCAAEYDAATLHYLFFADKWKQVAYQFKSLVPKQSIKEEAELALKEYSGPSNIPITTVHRRDLEGACVIFAEQKNLIACPNTKSIQEMSVGDYKKSCLIDYPSIANETNGSNVVLMTDGQVPTLDQTFPIISHHTFPVQAWMMAISNVHYGNPFSTVDVVVYFWRMALQQEKMQSNVINETNSDDIVDMRPSACYKETPTM